jgi:signal transduction histidine kinase
MFENENLDESGVRKLLRRMVEDNKEILGACIAYRPYFHGPATRYFSNYYYRSFGSIRYVNLGNEHYDYFLMDWYQIPKELNKAMWSEPFFDTGGSDRLISTYSIPIYQGSEGKKEFVGILAIDISLDWLQEYMNQIKVYDTGYGFILSKTGIIVTHPVRNIQMNETVFSIADEQESPDLRRIGRNMIRGETSFAEIEYRNVKTGKLSWIAYAPISMNGWSIGVVFPVDEFLSDANRLRKLVVGMGVGGGALLVMVIIWIAASITRPLRRLTRATEAFASGEFDVELPLVRSKDEIGTLTSAFVTMQEKLAGTINDLREASENLRISHAQLEEYSKTLEQKVEERTATLKAAQAQLVQSEKMASLGQLTAGIAHEIKNPLNFVNNFSELSIELASEMVDEIGKLSGMIDPKDSEYLTGIMKDIEGNVRKINEHGKRADSIIRGMLLHSRGKPGEMQPTDINALLAEYVALGYHGIRATDNSFNIKIETDYDDTIGRINVVPQDISRVFLNLINNACYSTVQKKSELRDAYFPILTVSTKRMDDKIIIKIRDNGKGIPPQILDRIFNPFFTTKPAGSGTGLGLSISYDIVVQEHNGEIKVDSREGEYAEFTVILPVR